MGDIVFGIISSLGATGVVQPAFKQLPTRTIKERSKFYKLPHYAEEIFVSTISHFMG